MKYHLRHLPAVAQSDDLVGGLTEAINQLIEAVFGFLTSLFSMLAEIFAGVSDDLE